MDPNLLYLLLYIKSMMYNAIVTFCPGCIVCYFALLFSPRNSGHFWGSCHHTEWLDYYAALIVIDAVFEDMICVPSYFVFFIK